MILLTEFEKIAPDLPQGAWAIVEKAFRTSEERISRAAEIVDAALSRTGVDPSMFCFAAIGSVGRREALDASDLDLVPIALDEAALVELQRVDQDIRRELRDKLGVAVSAGEDLTKATSIEAMIDPSRVADDAERSGDLTRRALLLTESAHVSGGLPLEEVRRRILGVYADSRRTSGRHLLSFSNDMARYYRTLCMEYKARVDNRTKCWSTRNMKLRHSRKFWYFSLMVSVARLAEEHPGGAGSFEDELLEILDLPPILRLFSVAEEENRERAGSITARYAEFLDYMAAPDRRERLERVEHDERHDPGADNPFPKLKENSDLLHREMVEMLYEFSPTLRARILDWFLF